MREFTFMFVLGQDIACAGDDAANVRRRATSWSLTPDMAAELESFLETARAGYYLDIRDKRDMQRGVLVCTYCREVE